MPCFNNFWGKELFFGAYVAVIYTCGLGTLLFGLGLLHIKTIKNDDSINYEYMSKRLKREREFKIKTGEIYVAFGVLFVLGSVALIFGIRYKNLLLIWLWILIVGVGDIFMLSRHLYHGFFDPILGAVESGVGCLLLFIELYFFIVVYSFKQECVKQQSLNQQATTMKTLQEESATTVENGKDLAPADSIDVVYCEKQLNHSQNSLSNPSNVTVVQTEKYPANSNDFKL